MVFKVVQLLLAAAVVVLLLALAQIGHALKQLKGRFDAIETPPAAPTAIRAYKPMLGAIMTERESPLDGLAHWPGGRLAGAAAALALLAVAAGLLSGGPRPDPAATKTLTTLGQRVDSISAMIVALRDTVAASRTESAPVVATKATPAAKPAARPTRQVLAQARTAAPRKPSRIKLPPAPEIGVAIPPARADTGR